MQLRARSDNPLRDPLKEPEQLFPAQFLLRLGIFITGEGNTLTGYGPQELQKE